MNPCTRLASPATNLPKIGTLSLLVTRLKAFFRSRKEMEQLGDSSLYRLDGSPLRSQEIEIPKSTKGEFQCQTLSIVEKELRGPAVLVFSFGRCAPNKTLELLSSSFQALTPIAAITGGWPSNWLQQA